MWCDSDGVGVVSSVQDEARSSLLPVGFNVDGIVCGCSLCTLNGGRCDCSEQYWKQGKLSAWGDGMNVDVDVDADDLCDGALGNAKGRRRPSL